MRQAKKSAIPVRDDTGFFRLNAEILAFYRLKIADSSPD
jgi:hypothetical protein